MSAIEKTHPVHDFCANCGVTMDVEYIPTRNAEQIRKKDGHWPMLKYRVTLSKGNVSHAFSCNAGIGHVKGLKTSNLTLDDEAKLLHIYKTGKKARFYSNIRSQVPEKNLAYTPELADVLYLLVSESDVLEHDSFESWASEFGYDTDSRHAEQIYQMCISNALKLRQLIDIDAARVAFENF